MTRSLWDVWGAIADRRGRRGGRFRCRRFSPSRFRRCWRAPTICATIFRWGRRLKARGAALFGIERAPCHATYHYVFRSLDGDALARALGGFACGRDEPGHIALDGKTLRGSRRLDAKALHVVSAFATQLSAVVGDPRLRPRANEITAGLALDRKGCEKIIAPLHAHLKKGDNALIGNSVYRRPTRAAAHRPVFQINAGKLSKTPALTACSSCAPIPGSTRTRASGHPFAPSPQQSLWTRRPPCACRKTRRIHERPYPCAQARP